MLGKPKLEHPALICLLLAMATMAVFLPVVGLDITNYDDPDYVTHPRVQTGLTWESLSWAFTHAHSGNWHPLTSISHMLDFQLYGLKPAGHHLTNLLFHATNSLLLFLLLRGLTGAVWRSACVAALFALHPLHVESVAWVAERKDVLSAFFGLLSLLAYARYTQAAVAPLASHASRMIHHPRSFFYLLALSFFAMGLMSKPMLVTWPCAMLLLDYWPLRRFELATLWRLVVEKVPFFALSAASCVVTFAVQKAWGAVVPLEHAPLGLRFLNALVCYFGYIWKLVRPTNLAVIYPYVRNWPPGDVIVSLLVLAAITILALWQRKARPFLLVGWAWYLGTLVPVIGLVQVGNQAMADRYTYLPAIGLFLMLVWGIAEIIGARPGCRAVAALSATAMLTACSLLTQAQVMVWQNTETLFQHALAVTTNNFVAYNSLGFYFSTQREADKAKRYFHAGLAVNPACQFAWEGLANVLIEQGKLDEAISDCQAALQLNPGMAEAHGTLGLALIKQGKTNEAVAQYSEAIRLRPDYAPAHYNLANALAAQGEIEQARQHYQESLRSDPSSPDAHNNLAYMLAREGKLDEAVSQFKAALALRPALWNAHYGLADALDKQRNYEAAAKEFSEVLRLKPDHAQAHYRLAVTLNRTGRIIEAMQHYRATLLRLPDFAPALDRLAWILATSPNPQLRDGAQAVELAERACKVTEYKHPIMVGTLAAAYAEAGRFPEAVNSAEKAHSLAQALGQKEFARRSQQFLELFEASRPYHEGGGRRSDGGDRTSDL